MLAEISSRIAACGQPPVSIARIRSAGRASLRMRNSWSSLVKMSLVTAANTWVLNDQQSAAINDVGRWQVSDRATKNFSVISSVPMLYFSRNPRQRAKSNAVFPDPTGLAKEVKSASHDPRYKHHRNLPADTNGEGSLCPVPSGVVWHVPFSKLAWRKQHARISFDRNDTTSAKTSHTHRHVPNAHGCVHAPQGSRVLDHDHETVHDRGACYHGYEKWLKTRRMVCDGGGHDGYQFLWPPGQH